MTKKTARKKAKKWRASLRSVATRIVLALTKTDPVGAASLPETAPAKPAEVYRAVSAAEIIKRVGEVRTYEEGGDRVMEFAPRGWHREESFAYNKNKPTPVTTFTDQGKFGEK